MEDRGRWAAIYRVIWDDQSFRSLSKNDKLLFFYLRTCSQGNLACIFEIFPDQIERITGLTGPELKRSLDSLCHSLWIGYLDGWVWVRNGLKFDPTFTPSNPKHQIALQKCLAGLPHIQLVIDFVDYYKKIGYLSIGYDIGYTIGYGIGYPEKNGDAPPITDYQKPITDSRLPDTIGSPKNFYLDLEKEAWETYPITEPKARSQRHLFRRQWEARIKEGEPPESILDGIKKFAAYNIGKDPAMIPGAQVFIGPQKKYLGWIQQEEPGISAALRKTTAAFDALDALAAKKNHEVK